MKVIALKDLPDGTPAGRVIDITPEVAEILMLPGVDSVRPATEDEAAPRRRGYIRRDMRAA